MARSKIYLETSIFSRFGDPQTVEKRRVTETFIRKVAAKHGTYISMAVLGELAEIRDRERAKAIARRLWALDPEVLQSQGREEGVAKELLAAGRWSTNHYADMLHIAYTMLASLDMLVTWDVEDLARDRTRAVVQAYAWQNSLGAPLIGTPEEAAGWLGIEIQ